jgi:hypothetical protein
VEAAGDFSTTAIRVDKRLEKVTHRFSLYDAKLNHFTMQSKRGAVVMSMEEFLDIRMCNGLRWWISM